VYIVLSICALWSSTVLYEPISAQIINKHRYCKYSSQARLFTGFLRTSFLKHWNPVYNFTSCFMTSFLILYFVILVILEVVSFLKVFSLKLCINFNIKVCFVVFCKEGKKFAQKELYPVEYMWKKRRQSRRKKRCY
jgi:hypothetical protein